MIDKVFYSWQSDSPGSTNRNLISVALEKAIKEIKNDDTVEIEPVINRDTLGVAGSPDISHSIFSKIDSASVFVCDVSIINSEVKKPSPNPNVLIELGYAIKVLGWNRIVMVMNTEYGRPETLPFDLRSKRILTYCIAPDAKEKAPARNSLKKTLNAALKLILENHAIDKGNTPVELEHVKPLDVELFKKLKKVIPSKGSISFIDEQNMAGFSWPRDKLQ